jgi:hypothetical protein
LIKISVVGSNKELLNIYEDNLQPKYLVCGILNFNTFLWCSSDQRQSHARRQGIRWKNYSFGNLTVYTIDQTTEMALHVEPLTSCLAAERLLMKHANGAIEM